MHQTFCLLLCAVLVVTSTAQAQGGVQHIKLHKTAVRESSDASTTSKDTPTVTANPTPTKVAPTVTAHPTPTVTAHPTPTVTASPTPTKVTPRPSTAAPTHASSTEATTAKPTPPGCKKGDKKPVDGSCKDYVECDSNGKWLPKSCSTFCKVFEQKVSKCVWNWQSPCLKPPTTVAPPPTPAPTNPPSTVPTTTLAPECTNEGQMKPLKKGNCKDYLQCSAGKWTQKSCSFGYDFDINKNACTWSWWAKC